MVQRDSTGPLDWATDLLHSVTGDASRDESGVQNDATAASSELESQGTSRSTELQTETEAQSASIQSEGTSQTGRLNQRSESEGTALQDQAGGQGSALAAESAARSTAIQDDAAGTSAQLEGGAGELDTHTRSSTNETTVALGTEITGTQTEAQTNDAQVHGQWTSLETQGSGRLKDLTARTQTLAEQKTALVQEYQSPGQHDPERFQKRWKDLQGQVGTAEQAESSLHRVEDTGAATSKQAETMWARLTSRGQSLLSRVGDVASRSWSALQERWSALQGTAAKAIAGVRQRANAAVAGLKNLGTLAWTRLRNLTNQAWPRLQNMATGAWTALQSRATAAWTSLRSKVSAAWNALKRAADSAIQNLTSKISGIIGRIQGAVGRILQALAGAVAALLARVRDTTSRALSSLADRAGAAWNAVKDLGGRAWEGLKDLGTRAWEELKNLGTRAWEGLKSLGTRLWGKLKDLGQRMWAGLESLAKRAWNALGKTWEWLKGKLEATWRWVKKAWEAVKNAAAKMWAWLKSKAKEALAWLKRKWDWLKAMIRKGIAWLKAKWKWLKSLVKIKICLPDVTLVRLINFKPWKFVDLDSGRIPFVKGVVDTPLGPVELALLARAQAEATIGGSICPCTLKNTCITLQPLISRYTGETELHIPGKAEEKLVLTGTIGGSANLGGAVGIAEGGLKGTGTALGFGSLVVSPRIVYDSGKISFSERFRLEFCLKPTISLDAFARLVATTSAPPSSGGGGGGRGTPILPPGPLPLGGSPGARTSSVPAVAGPSPSPAAGKKPPEKVLWEGTWHIGSISKQECWNIGAKFTLTFNNGVPELDVEFDAQAVSVREVVRSMIEGIKLSPAPGGAGILKDITASGICKCVGDDQCGGGKRYKVCVKTQKDCKKAQKDVDDFCNNNSEMKEKCTRPKCYYRHSEAICPDDCEAGVIQPLGDDGPTVQGGCRPVSPSGSPTVNKPAAGNDCTPDIPSPTWDVVSADSANWGVCVASLPLSGTINIKPWPSIPNKMVTPNTANPVDGGNINDIAGSKNHWQYAIDDMADYDLSGPGGAGPDWHSTEASEAHEWAHWESDFKADSLTSRAGGDWSIANSDLNSLREPKSSSSTPLAAKAALKPKVDARVKAFRSAVVKRWNDLIGKTDSPGKGGRGYAAGMAVLNQIIGKVRSYKNRKGW